MLRSSSKSSLGRKSHYEQNSNDPTKNLFHQIYDTLQQASLIIPYLQLEEVYENIMKSCMKKSQIQKKQNIYLPFLKKLILKFKPTLEISIRVMILQAKSQHKIIPEETLELLTKIKHTIINTQYEYLLSKVFIIEAKTYQVLEHKDIQAKSLRKCISFTQNFVIQYLQQKQQIRRQITENVVMAYFELYKLKRQSNPKEAEQFLNKACRTTQKMYDQQSQVAEMLNCVYNNHKNLQKSINQYNNLRFSQQYEKAITEIVEKQVQRQIKIIAFYSWEDQSVIAQLVKENKKQRKVISETEYHIKLDMVKIKQLRNSQWLEINKGKIIILEDQLLKALGVKQDHTVATRIGLKTISREDIIKKDSLSSSSQDPSFIEKQDFNFIRRLGRAQSAKRQQNN